MYMYINDYIYNRAQSVCLYLQNTLLYWHLEMELSIQFDIILTILKHHARII